MMSTSGNGLGVVEVVVVAKFCVDDVSIVVSVAYSFVDIGPLSVVRSDELSNDESDVLSGVDSIVVLSLATSDVLSVVDVGPTSVSASDSVSADTSDGLPIYQQKIRCFQFWI